MTRPTNRQLQRAPRPQRVRTQADFAKLNLSDVARGTGISVSHVSRIFGGLRTPSLDVAETISNYLGVGLGEFTKFLATVKKTA
jgi:transcriptional regulator with XRE-family HTH domain